MAKVISRESKVVLYGVDVTDVVLRWAVIAEVGDVVRVELDVPATFFLAMKIQTRPSTSKGSARHPTDRAEVFVNDGSDWSPDIAKHVYGWETLVRVGKEDVVRIRLHADSDVITINGTTPWEN